MRATIDELGNQECAGPCKKTQCWINLTPSQAPKPRQRPQTHLIDAACSRPEPSIFMSWHTTTGSVTWMRRRRSAEPLLPCNLITLRSFTYSSPTHDKSVRRTALQHGSHSQGPFTLPLVPRPDQGVNYFPRGAYLAALAAPLQREVHVSMFVRRSIQATGVSIRRTWPWASNAQFRTPYTWPMGYVPAIGL